MSKRSEAIKQLRDMTEAELEDHLRQHRRRLFELRFQQATGQVENHRQVREARREIARTMTVQIELQRAASLESTVAHDEAPSGPVPARAPSRARARRAPVPSLAGHPTSPADSASNEADTTTAEDVVEDVAEPEADDE